jgi:hypothetical protein
MPRPKLDLTEEERQERLKEQRRKNSLAYYYRNNPSKTPRMVLDNVDEMKEFIQKRKDYFKQYYEQHKEELIKKANDWKRTHKGLAITTQEVLCD